MFRKFYKKLELTMKNLFTYRLLNFYCLLITIILLATAAYVQFVGQVEPCPLCIIQRIIVAILLLIFFIGIFYLPASLGRKIYGSLITVIGLSGAIIAGRQVYLQHLPPDQAPICTPSFNVLVSKLPIEDAMRILVQGSGDCSKVTWRFLELSMAEWMVILFIFFALIGVIQMLKK